MFTRVRISPKVVCMSAPNNRANHQREPHVPHNSNAAASSGPAAAAAEAPRPRAPAAKAADPRLEAATVQITLQGRNFKLSDAVKSYAEEKLSKALKPFEAEIKAVDARFELHDRNHGQSHGQSQKTEIVVHTLHNGTVVVEEVEDELYASIDLAVDKVKRALRKTKERAIERGRWPGHAGARGSDLVGELALGGEEEDKSEDEYLKEAGPLGPFKK